MPALCLRAGIDFSQTMVILTKNRAKTSPLCVGCIDLEILRKMLHEGLVWKIRIGGASPLLGAGLWRSYSFVLGTFVLIRNISTVWPDFDRTLKMGSSDHLSQTLTCMVTFVHATFVMTTCAHIRNISAAIDPILTKLLYCQAQHKPQLSWAEWLYFQLIQPHTPTHPGKFNLQLVWLS